jgi:pimeloyl-ACP methyl ester carboxylesterase
LKAVYLHGFASGPSSRKARFFEARLRESGVSVLVPDLAAGDFENLTVSSQMAVIDDAVGTGPVHLLGSSMGGYLAALFAARNPGRVEKLVLLAPAFGFAARWPSLVGEEAVARWLSTGKLPVYHYAENRMRDLGLSMFEDANLWEPEPAFSQPALIFHGVKDAVVPVAASRSFASAHRNVKLTEMDSGHELTDVLPEVWEGCRNFLLSEPRPQGSGFLRTSES